VPYTTQERRSKITASSPECNVGDLTYLVSELIETYREVQGDSYQTFIECIAACEQTADEFKQRVVHPYEVLKLEENGPVFANINREPINE
jgi:hypothetical protein